MCERLSVIFAVFQSHRLSLRVTIHWTRLHRRECCLQRCRLRPWCLLWKRYDVITCYTRTYIALFALLRYPCLLFERFTATPSCIELIYHFVFNPLQGSAPARVATPASTPDRHASVTCVAASRVTTAARARAARVCARLAGPERSAQTVSEI